MRREGEEGATEDAGDTAQGKPGPAVGVVADAVAYRQGAGDRDKTGGSVEEGGVGGGETEVFD